MRLAPDTLIAGRYRVRERLAGGGMGEVWRADDERLSREVAVKVIRPELADDPDFLARFRVEARAAAGLAHPGVVAVHDFGDDDEGAYLVMELVRGGSLGERLGRDGRLDVEATLDLLAQAGEALQAAHDAGVIHRDVKPGNLLLRADGRLQVTDFGTARAIGVTSVTVTGALVGTPHYMAPEQVSGGEPTAAGDVFALGVVAYECLAGRKPFDGATVPAVVVALVHTEPAPLPDDVPPAVAALVLDCLARDPNQRVSSARQVAARARALMTADTPLPTVPIEGLPEPSPARRASRVWLGVAALAFVIAAAILIILLAGSDDPKRPAPEPTPTVEATATVAPSPSPTASPVPSPTAAATSAATTAPKDAFIGDPARAVVRRLEARGYDVTLTFSTSTRGTPAPGTVYALAPSPLPDAPAKIQVIAQPTR